MDDVGDAVPLDDVEEPRQVVHVAELDVNLFGDVADEIVVAVAGIDDRPVPLLDELPAGLGADHAHAAGNQDFHIAHSIQFRSDRLDPRLPNALNPSDKLGNLLRRKIDPLEAVGAEELTRLRQVQHLADVRIICCPSSGAMFAGPNRANQAVVEKPGTPASAMVGSSGRAATRFSPAAARILTFPVFS